MRDHNNGRGAAAAGTLDPSACRRICAGCYKKSVGEGVGMLQKSAGGRRGGCYKNAAGCAQFVHVFDERPGERREGRVTHRKTSVTPKGQRVAALEIRKRPHRRRKRLVGGCRVQLHSKMPERYSVERPRPVAACQGLMVLLVRV